MSDTQGQQWFDVDDKGAVVTVTMQRPPVNAFNPEFAAGLKAIVMRMERRTDLRVLHFRSNQRFFSAGADLNFVKAVCNAEDPAIPFTNFLKDRKDVLRRIESLRCVTIAEVNGGAMGGGCELALTMDFRIADDDALLGLPEAKHGLVPGSGGTQRLTRLCGRGVAKRIMMTGELVRGTEAERLGMVDWAVPKEQRADKVQELIEQILPVSPLGIDGVKRAIEAQENPEIEGFNYELTTIARLIRQPDTLKRVSSFFERK